MKPHFCSPVRSNHGAVLGDRTAHGLAAELHLDHIHIQRSKPVDHTAADSAAINKDCVWAQPPRLVHDARC